MLETITTVDGTLYKEEIVTYQNKEDDGDWREGDPANPIDWKFKGDPVT